MLRPCTPKPRTNAWVQRPSEKRRRRALTSAGASQTGLFLDVRHTDRLCCARNTWQGKRSTNNSMKKAGSRQPCKPSRLQLILREAWSEQTVSCKPSVCSCRVDNWCCLMGCWLGIRRYLHSAFEDPEQGRRNPIIHRDLKSPNLLLSRSPPRSAMDPDVTLKISDFGSLAIFSQRVDACLLQLGMNQLLADCRIDARQADGEGSDADGHDDRLRLCAVDGPGDACR